TMSSWWRTVTGNWRDNPARTAAVILSVAVGVGAVVIVSTVFETARWTIREQAVKRWLGAAHLTIYPPGAHWGSMAADVADDLRKGENIRFVTARLRRWMRLIPAEKPGKTSVSRAEAVDAVGIRPETEVHFRTWSNLEGRMLKAGERGSAVVDRLLAVTYGLGTGDTVILFRGGSSKRKRFRIVGIFDAPRLAAFQRPIVYLALKDLQELTGEPGVVSAVDVMLADPSPQAIKRAKRFAETVLAERHDPYPLRIETAAAREMMLAEAERITRLLLTLAAFVAMLTSFFIILTTQSVSLIQRRPQLGVLRCLGATRGQLVRLLLAELMPLGILGTVLGLLGGIGLCLSLGPGLSPSGVIRLGAWGLLLATACGIGTALLSVAFLAYQTASVTPLEAVRIHARPARIRLVAASGVAGTDDVFYMLNGQRVDGKA
ncbi:MAG: FtsX-like permease family protein, partial [Planctomycetota bacterium]